METLVTIGVAGSIPFVLQFLMDYYTNGNTTNIPLRTKINLSMSTGVVLSIFLALYTGAFPDTVLGIVFLLADGVVAGAVASGVVGIGFKVADKIG